MFRDYIGQASIVRELSSMSKYINGHLYKNPSFHVTLSGIGGFGKTHLAETFCKSINTQYTYQIPNDGYVIFDERASKFLVHFIDEIHLAKNQEILYKPMDDKKYVFILCTTDPGLLNEPLLTRTIHYRFGNYTVDELVDIIMLHATETLNITRQSARIIAERCRGNPRVAITYTKRVILLIYSGYYKNNIYGIVKACEDIGIYDLGYTELDHKYMQAIEKVGLGNLTLLSNMVGVDKLTVREEIEPFLIERGHITITPRGRQFLKGI